MRHTRIWVVSILLVTSLVSAAPATGGEPVDPNLGDIPLGKAGGIRYAMESSTYSDASEYAQVDVGCGGPKWHLIGGGSHAGGDPAGSWIALGRPLDYDDADDVPDDGWYTGGFGSNPASFTGYSVCIRDTNLRYRQRSVADAPTGERSGTINCGGGWAVTSGSPFIATSDSWVHSSFPRDGSDADNRPDDGWQGTAWDTIGGAGGFYVHAVCTNDHHVRYVKRTPLNVAPASTGNRRVACRGDEHVVGGGVRLTGSPELGRLVSSFPYDGRDADAVPDDGWQVRVHNGAGNEKKATAFAICLS